MDILNEHLYISQVLFLPHIEVTQFLHTNYIKVSYTALQTFFLHIIIKKFHGF